MHADASLVINGGDIQIAESYEGIESAVITDRRWKYPCCRE